MSKRDKRIQKLLRKPAYFPFEDLDIILRDAGYIRRNSGGSHFSHNKPGVPHVLTVPVPQWSGQANLRCICDKSARIGDKMTLQEYLELPYTLAVTPMPEDEGGGYYARFTEFKEGGAHGDGPTIEEAAEQARISLKLVLEVMLEDGHEIPLPRTDDQFSGRFVIRAPRSLHRKLSETAEAEGTSLNQLVISYLSTQVGAHNRNA